MIQNLKEGDQCDSILSQFQQYESVLLPHIKEEEETVIPLMRRYFTPAEMSPVSRQFFTDCPKVSILKC
jgi:hemerythrin-like domain-containing protein